MTEKITTTEIRKILESNIPYPNCFFKKKQLSEQFDKIVAQIDAIQNAKRVAIIPETT